MFPTAVRQRVPPRGQRGLGGEDTTAWGRRVSGPATAANGGTATAPPSGQGSLHSPRQCGSVGTSGPGAGCAFCAHSAPGPLDLREPLLRQPPAGGGGGQPAA